MPLVIMDVHPMSLGLPFPSGRLPLKYINLPAGGTPAAPGTNLNRDMGGLHSRILAFLASGDEDKGNSFSSIAETHPRRVTSRCDWTLLTIQDYPKHSSNSKSGPVAYAV